ncbi:MAG TPA: hypothetical protein VLX92_00710 [Kofleriaceae bacterium]|nr:hypothetical protein [Kofleriaceae bacterium]
MRASLLAAAVLVVLSGCERRHAGFDPAPNQPQPQPQPQPAPAPAESPGVATAPDQAGTQLSGKVAETMDASTYTYARLSSGVWLAGPKTKLEVGMVLGPMTGTEMHSFHSDTLNRTFDVIYFVPEFALPTGAPPPAAATATAGAGGGDDISGTVAETMDAGGYTYARLDHGGTSIWVAGPTTKLAVGTKVGKLTGTLMNGFHSDTLKRTFDKIYFVNDYGAPAAAAAGTEPAAPPVKVEKMAPPAGGKTIAEVYAGKDALAGKPVIVGGKVVKVNNDIMGRNWVHLRDGTGAAGSDDLLVTSTSTTAKVGDSVVVHGTIATHQDFGASYKYDVMVENATIAPR